MGEYPSRHVLVVGGGVAGIAAATSLADAGFRVELIEKRPLLGGRASSHIDPATGERRDECQHGTMRCCTNLADLLERLGVHDRIRYHDAIHFLDREGKRSVIKSGGLPAPMHTGISFFRFKSLELRDKLGIARGLIAILRARPDPRHDAQDIAAWFRQTGQTERAVRRFWEPILVSACNESLERISCTHAFKVFREGFLIHPQAFHFGIPSVPLGTLYTEPTIAYLQKRGGCVHTRTIVQAFHVEANRVTGAVLANGQTVTADYYVSALPADLLLKLLPPSATEGVPYFESMKHIEFSPIIGIHLWFDRVIDCPDALALLDRETDWIFNKTKNFGLPESEGTYLSLVISAPGALARRSKEELVALGLEDVRACLPETRAARLIRSAVVRWPRATFVPEPGVEARRPDQRSPMENLYIAGEWTQTGWPSTMESAARSGYRAAEYILAREGIKRRVVAPDLPPSGLAKWLLPKERSSVCRRLSQRTFNGRF